jgi:hypothetical protein
MAITITARPCPDTDLEINGTPEGSFTAGSTIDLQLTDGVNPVTPVSVGRVGDTVTVEVAAGGGLDPDAEAFLTAASITDATITGAIDTLVTDLKSFGLWNKMRAIYPFVGGTASTHKWNLKDPRDANNAQRAEFFGGITHSATGADPNGTNGYADLHILAAAIGISDIHLSFYSRENTHTGAGDNVDIGHVTTSSNRCFLSTGISSANNPLSGMGNSLLSTTGAADGFFIGTFNFETPSNFNRLYKNGTQIISGTGGKVTDVISNLNLFRLGGLNTAYANRECAFASVGFGLTATDAANFNTIVQAFQTTLSRNV